MRKKRGEEKIKGFIKTVAEEINEERRRKTDILYMHVERTKTQLFNSFSEEQKQLFEDYEQAQAEYCNFMLENQNIKQ